MTTKLTGFIGGELEPYKSGDLHIDHGTRPIISVMVSQNLGAVSSATLQCHLKLNLLPLGLFPDT